MDYCENISEYLRSTKGSLLIFEEGLELRVGGYTDADSRMSTSACILELCWFDLLEGFQIIDQWKLNMLYICKIHSGSYDSCRLRCHTIGCYDIVVQR